MLRSVYHWNAVCVQGHMPADVKRCCFSADGDVLAPHPDQVLALDTR